MKAIILCNGTDAGWNGHLGVPKQLIKIDGETILARTVRQCRQRDVESVVISTSRPELKLPGVEVLELNPEPYRTKTPAGLNTVCAWATDENTVLLLGDVRYSDSAISEVLNPRDLWTFFCRFGPRYGKNEPIGGEGWAVQFPAHEQGKYLRVLNYLALLDLPGQHFWQQYRAMNSADPLIHKILDGHVIIDDETEDFDYPGEIEVWLNKHPHHIVDGVNS